MYKLFVKKNITTKELLDYVLKKYKIEDEIIYNEYGKPYLKKKELYLNLSNSYDYSVCVISDKEIGVDIEKIQIKPRLIDKICTEEEKEKIKTSKDFTKIWVKKESYVKYLGIGIGYGLKNVDTLRKGNYKVIKKGDYYIAICFGE